MKGFFGSILTVDLSNRTFRTEHPEEGILRKFLGGKGLGTHLLLARNPPGVDPFAPENRLVLALGPASDSPVYGSCRHGIYSKSPLTGFYAESYSGGSAAIAMSRTGYDAVVIEGASARPVLLEITHRGVFFHDADDLWGLDTHETEAAVKSRIDAKAPGVLVIGPAGENRVRFAVVKNDGWRVAGRTGMGAVLGSKKVKAVVFHGNQSRPFAHPREMKDYSTQMRERLAKHPGVEAYRNLGTPMMVAIMNNAGAFPTRFYAFGGLCMIDRIEEIVYLNDLCDRLGVDTISAGNLCAFAIEASGRGRIGESFEYGNVEHVSGLLRKIVHRSGIGGLLAEGIRSAADELDLKELAVHVKGLEPAGYDPRILKGMGLAYAVSDRGACHLRSTFYKPELAGIIDPDRIEGKAELFIDFEDRCTLFDTLILCRFYRDFYPWEELSRIIEMTTGDRLGKPELQALAASVTDNARRFNLREGLRPEDDRLPIRFHRENLPDGSGIAFQDLKTLVSDYYRLRGWDEAGVPSQQFRRVDRVESEEPRVFS